MTLYDVLNAKSGFQKLVTQNLPVRTAYKLSRMVRRINEELEFYHQREAEIKAKHEYRVPDAERAELLNLEIDWTEDKIEIPLDADIHLSCADVDALTPFIEFKEVEKNAEN